MAERALFHDGLPSAPGLEVEVHRGFLVDADEQFPALLEETPWSRDAIVVFGQKRPIPRMEAWYGDAGRTYRYSGRRLEPLPWTSRLAELRDRCATTAGEAFDSVLVTATETETTPSAGTRTTNRNWGTARSSPHCL